MSYEDFDHFKTKKNYKKPSEFAEGENRIRIVGKPIFGWLHWVEKKPCRSTVDNKPVGIDSKELKFFMACYVWDYKAEDLYIVEFTQAGILTTLKNYSKDPDWGEFVNYDIKLIKSGSGMDTEYEVMPCIPKDMSPDIKEFVLNTPVRLDALFEGKDPWNDLNSNIKAPSVFSEEQKLRESLREALLEDDEAEDRILKALKIKSVEEIKSSQIPGLLVTLNKRKGEKNVA